MAGSKDKTTDQTTPNPGSGEEERIPVMQRVFNPFLLLFLGVAMPTVLYLISGIMEIVQIPIAK